MRFPLLITAALWLSASQLVHASEVNRVLSTFDFEERRLGNPEETPMYWAKVEGEGFPHYIDARLTTDRARSGKYSFRFDLNGGSLLYRYPAGRIRVRPGSHYRVEGMCQTTVMPAARARLTAYLTDVDGVPITGTTRHSELYAATADKEGWKRLGFELAADAPDAAFVVLELGLLQPAQYADKLLGERTLHEQDIRGTAWFDDLSVSQVPRVTLSSSRPGNVFRRSDPLQLQVLVNDRFTDDLAGQLAVRDPAGRVAFQWSGALDMSAAEVLGPGRKRVRIDLPELPPGWYAATLVMASKGQFVGQQTIDLVRLPDDAPPAAPDPRFGLIATDLPFDGWGELPDVLPMLSAGRVKLAVWSAAGDIEDTDAADFHRLLERLDDLGIKPTACLLELPPTLAAKLKGSDWTQVLAAPAEDWQPQLAYLVARHARYLDRWQLGADGSDRFVTDPNMRRAYWRVFEAFSSLVQAPDLAMPWPAWYELEGELPSSVALSVPPSVLPSQIPLYVGDVGAAGGAAPTRHGGGRNLSLSLELLDRTRYGRETQIRDFAQRVVYALSAGANRIDVPLPFAVRRDGDALVKQPQEMLLVVRTLLTTLSGATYRGRVPLAEGVEAFLFDRDGKGLLVVWDRGSDGGVKRLALNLGPRAASVDLWGNATPLLRTRGERGRGEVQVNVGPMPLFLVDIDGQQAQLRASVALDRPLIESSFTSHPRRLTFTNPYRTAIGGTVRLKAPAGWTLNPPTFTFTLNPGERFDRELTIEFPYNSFAGTKTINAEFDLGGDTSGDFAVPITLNLGLSDVGTQTLALRDGGDVVVQQMISNYGSVPIDYTAFAVFPGQARQERLVTKLGAGQTTVKRYRFKQADVSEGVRIRAGVKELEGTRILNEEVEIQ